MHVQTMPACMADLPVDLQHPNRALIHGLFAETVTVGQSRRGFLTYIPPEQEYCRPCLVTAIPAGEDPSLYLETAGLKDFADRHRLYLHLATPGNGQWNSDGTDADYLNAIYVAIQSRNYYVTMQDNIYLCGISDGALIAHQAAAKMASEWSGLMTFGDLTARLSAHAPARGGEDQGDVELKIQGTPAQLPVWMVIGSETEANESALTYWKAQNHIVGAPLQGDGADVIWMPSPVRTRNELNEEQISQVRLTVAKPSYTPALLETLWAYIGMARRHRGQGQKCLRYYKDPEACGAVRKAMEVDGMVRTWYEYIPDSCKDGGPWPLVVVCHGRGGSAETFFDLSGMSVVAEARRFIAVFPEAGLHQQKKGGLRNVLLWSGSYEDKPIDDAAFIRQMVESVCSRYHVDRARIYACGQSSGGMMSDYLGDCAGDLFAACAPWSALRNATEMHCLHSAAATTAPTMWLYGDHDFLCAGKEPDPELPFSPTPLLRPACLEKLNRHGLSAAHYQTWTTDPITWYAFPNAQGIPLFVVGVVRDMVHANYPEESWISYDQFLSQFRLDSQGRRYYRGQLIDEAPQR